MTDKELIETFGSLISLIQEQGLGWLAEAVSSEIQGGRIEEAESERIYEATLETGPLELGTPYRKSLRKARFLVRREFTGRERLSLLVDAIEAAVSDASDVEQHILSSFSESAGPADYAFEDAAPSPARSEVHLELARSRSSAARGLVSLLNELRREISI